jgi:hypothetical protein
VAQENILDPLDPQNRELAQKAADHYEMNLAKKNFKNLTKDLYVKMLLNGGVQKYMSENYKDHTIPEHTFANIEKGGSLSDFSIIDRELERLRNPAHKSQYLTIPPNVALYTPIIQQPLFQSTSTVDMPTVSSLSQEELYKHLGI